MERRYKSLEDFWDYQEIEVQYGPEDDQIGVITGVFTYKGIGYLQIITPTGEDITVTVTSCKPPY